MLKKRMDIKNYTIVIRSVGERTEQMCARFLEHFFETDEIYCVKDVSPFANALLQSLQIGIECNRKWTFIVDADVFFYEDRLRFFLDFAEECVEQYPKLLCIMPYVYDNFFEKSRSAGVHLYLTDNIACSLGFINYDSLRAETYLIRSAAALGYDSLFYERTIGLHDFFQSYEDIVRKGILHSKKHADITELKRKWQNGIDKNDDYKWILVGCEIADSIEKKDMKNDIDYMNRLMELNGIKVDSQEELSYDRIEEKLYELRHIEFCEKVEPYHLYKKNIWYYIHEFSDKISRYAERRVKEVDAKE